jgi:hypothetical protein
VRVSGVGREGGREGGGVLVWWCMYVCKWCKFVPFIEEGEGTACAGRGRTGGERYGQLGLCVGAVCVCTHVCVGAPSRGVWLPFLTRRGESASHSLSKSKEGVREAHCTHGPPRKIHRAACVWGAKVGVDVGGLGWKGREAGMQQEQCDR